jgi:hypothetical protein
MKNEDKTYALLVFRTRLVTPFSPSLNSPMLAQIFPLAVFNSSDSDALKLPEIAEFDVVMNALVASSDY